MGNSFYYHYSCYGGSSVFCWLVTVYGKVEMIKLTTLNSDKYKLKEPLEIECLTESSEFIVTCDYLGVWGYSYSGIFEGGIE